MQISPPVRYLSTRIEELLGAVASAALRRENPVPARRVLEPLEDPAAILLRLFTLGAVTPHTAGGGAATLGIDGALRLGLVGPAAGERGARRPGGCAPAAALLDLAPYSAQDDAGDIDWWIASDLSELATGAPLGAEHVLGVGGASLTLARITPRERTGKVLDLGCGGGIQALHASRHAEHVVGTDLSERALAFAAFNAALNEHRSRTAAGLAAGTGRRGDLRPDRLQPAVRDHPATPPGPTATAAAPGTRCSRSCCRSCPGTSRPVAAP